MRDATREIVEPALKAGHDAVVPRSPDLLLKRRGREAHLVDKSSLTPSEPPSAEVLSWHALVVQQRLPPLLVNGANAVPRGLEMREVHVPVLLALEHNALLQVEVAGTVKDVRQRRVRVVADRVRVGKDDALQVLLGRIAVALDDVLVAMRARGVALPRRVGEVASRVAAFTAAMDFYDVALEVDYGRIVPAQVSKDASDELVPLVVAAVPGVPEVEAYGCTVVRVAANDAVVEDEDVVLERPLSAVELLSVVGILREGARHLGSAVLGTPDTWQLVKVVARLLDAVGNPVNVFLHRDEENVGDAVADAHLLELAERMANGTSHGVVTGAFVDELIERDLGVGVGSGREGVVNHLHRGQVDAFDHPRALDGKEVEPFALGGDVDDIL